MYLQQILETTDIIFTLRFINNCAGSGCIIAFIKISQRDISASMHLFVRVLEDAAHGQRCAKKARH